MPAWSPEIANDFIRMAANDGRAFDQMQLQKLVYIAHGWCLAITGSPLTGDRPEAWEFGPVYRRLADALGGCGRNPVTREIPRRRIYLGLMSPDPDAPLRSDLDEVERDLVWRIYQDYGGFKAAQLSTLTRRGLTPWAEIFESGAGKFRDIPHDLIRAQFVQLAENQEIQDHSR